MTGEKGVYADIPVSLWQVMDDDTRSKKDIITRGIERELGVDAEGSIAVIDRKIRRKETRLEDVQDEIDDLRTIRQRLKEELNELRAVREERAEGDRSYEALLDGVLDRMESGDIRHLVPDLDAVTAIVEEHDVAADEVMADLEARAAGQDRGILNTQFMRLDKAKQHQRQGDQYYVGDSRDGEGE